MSVRVTRKTARLLQAMLDAQEFDHPVLSADLMRHAHISANRFFPLMAALQNAEWVEEEWEVLPEGEHRPRHLFYKLTPFGTLAAQEEVARDTARFALWDMIKKGFKK